ncbi:dnaK protein [Tritrichomonas foetus]|uniref:DnaK protein n=1 Tax=Tritrichomonas foetus TaxID=1144522 RepID=A0A1J4JGT5_9EUKA|nr:dnaK protein [Tritrichomonas foetus]|eukprot:OHS96452.1 dnaK protein [Tritrichomonas foetus]
MIFYFLHFSACTVIGIDLGSSVLRASILSRNQPLRIAVNMNSKRETPNIFAFWNRSNPKQNISSVDINKLDEYEWSFGEAAQSQCLKRPHLCVYGNHIDDKQYLSFFKGYEITALSLYEAIHSLTIGELIEDSIKLVIAVPPILSMKQKVLLFTAAKYANADIVQFIDSTICPVHLYALERQSKYSNSIERVAFIDIGSSYSSVTIVEFDGKQEDPKYIQLSATFSEVGGSSLDEGLLDLISKENHIDLTNLKVRSLLLNEILKAKKMLVFLKSINIKFEYPGTEKIVSFNLTEQNLLKVSQKFNETMKQLIKDALKQANIEKVSSVELIGGSSRIPFIMELIQEQFHVSSVSHSLNAETAVSMGAGYFAASKSNSFVIKKVNGSSLIRSNVSLQVQNEKIELFNENDLNDFVRTVEIGSNLFSIHINNQLYSKYRITSSNFKNNDNHNHKYNVTFVSGDFLLPSVFSNGNYQIERMKSSWELTKEQFTNSENKINKLIMNLDKRRNTAKAANDFEEFMLKIKKIISTTKSLNKSDIIQLEKVLTEAEIWFDDGIERSQIEYENKLTYIKNNSVQIIEKENRIKKFEELKEELNNIKTIYNKENASDSLLSFIDELEKWLETNKNIASSSEIKTKTKELKNMLKENHNKNNNSKNNETINLATAVQLEK